MSPDRRLLVHRAEQAGLLPKFTVREKAYLRWLSEGLSRSSLAGFSGELARDQRNESEEGQQARKSVAYKLMELSKL